jgi:A/G-specific adenine glycosylase
MKPTQIAPMLVDWYDRSHRRLPWRVPPGSAERPDPYRVWLSEIMLQQTTVAAVIPYFEAFVRRWPTVAALAAADDREVMTAWAGLGYYARARNLLRFARAVGDTFPDSEAALRALPGIGAYTAAAIAAIAFDRPAVVVDGNVERVVARLFAVDDPLPAAKQRLRALAASITPDARPGDFAQAMMDLGATVCRPRAPDCPACPLLRVCTAHAQRRAEALPVKPAKPVRPLRYGRAYWLEHEGRVLTVRRPARGLLGGMRALPSSDFAGAPIASDAFPGAPGDFCWHGPVAHVRHVFTHFELRLDVFAARALDVRTIGGDWINRADLPHSGLPTVFRKAVQGVLASGGKERLAL